MYQCDIQIYSIMQAVGLSQLICSAALSLAFELLSDQHNIG